MLRFPTSTLLKAVSPFLKIVYGLSTVSQTIKLPAVYCVAPSLQLLLRGLTWERGECEKVDFTKARQQSICIQGKIIIFFTTIPISTACTEYLNRAPIQLPDFQELMVYGESSLSPSNFVSTPCLLVPYKLSFLSHLVIAFLPGSIQGVLI